MEGQGPVGFKLQDFPKGPIDHLRESPLPQLEQLRVGLLDKFKERLKVKPIGPIGQRYDPD
ncbi:hypothetical protein D3C86_1930330 [compost metagenome]